jgi:GNAT superfamily N-acetyltransferase
MRARTASFRRGRSRRPIALPQAMGDQTHPVPLATRAEGAGRGRTGGKGYVARLTGAQYACGRGRHDDRAMRKRAMSLNEEQGATLVSAMSKVKRLLQASFVRLEIEDPASANAQWCVEQYFAELNQRFENGFNRTAVLPADPEELRPPAGVFIIAKLHDQLVGCGAVKLHGRAPAELKRMWVSPAARGLGIGRRLLGQLELHAHDAGARAVRLETNRALREAISLYRRSGYVEVAPFNQEPHAHHWFEKRLATEKCGGRSRVNGARRDSA